MVALLLLSDLTRVKSDRACLPTGRRVPRPPRQSRPDFQPSGKWMTPCQRACALWQRPGGPSTGRSADRAGATLTAAAQPSHGSYHLNPIPPYSSTSPSFRGAGRGAGAAGLRLIRTSPFFVPIKRNARLLPGWPAPSRHAATSADPSETGAGRFSSLPNRRLDPCALPLNKLNNKGSVRPGKKIS